MAFLLTNIACLAIGARPTPTPSFAVPTPTATQRPTEAVPPTKTPEPVTMQIVGSPPDGQLYHGIYPGGPSGEEDDLTLDDLRSYEEAVGKTAAWVYFSHNWYRDRRFPLETATWIRDAGSVPYIRLMLRSDAVQGDAEPTFTLDRIIDGDFDDDLYAWASDARGFGAPFIAEFGAEVNGEWFSWNGVWNGGGTLDGYGDSTQPDSPARFREAYRHIIQIARDAGAHNMIWVFHVNAADVPNEEQLAEVFQRLVGEKEEVIGRAVLVER